MQPTLPEFYGIAAQVLPVIFLTLAFQMRGGFIPSPAEERYASLADLRPKMVEAVKEAQKLRWVDDSRSLTPEQFFERDAAAQAYAEDHADAELRRLADAAERSRMLTAVGSIMAIILLFLGEAMALRVLLEGKETDAAATLVQVALFVGAAMIAWPLLDRYIERIVDTHYILLRYRYRASLGLLGLLLALTYIMWN